MGMWVNSQSWLIRSKQALNIAFEYPGRAVVLAQDLMTLVQSIGTAPASAKAVGIGIGSRFRDRIQTKQI